MSEQVIQRPVKPVVVDIIVGDPEKLSEGTLLIKTLGNMQFARWLTEP